MTKDAIRAMHQAIHTDSMTTLSKPPSAARRVDGRGRDYLPGRGYWVYRTTPSSSRSRPTPCSAMGWYGDLSRGHGEHLSMSPWRTRATRTSGAEAALYSVTALLGQHLLLQGLAGD